MGTALHLALEGGHAEVAAMLVCWGADTLAARVKKSKWLGPEGEFAFYPGRRRPQKMDSTKLRTPEESDQWASCEDLCCKNGALLQALNVRYSRSTHHLFSTLARAVAKTVLMIAQ